MTFSVFLPQQAEAGGKLPVLWYLSGLTCTHANVTEKGEYRAACAEQGIVFVAPDGATVADPAFAAAIQQVVATAAETPQVGSVADPFVTQAIAPDGGAALATVSFDVLSYAGRLLITVVYDPDHVPDHALLADALACELTGLSGPEDLTYSNGR